MGSTLDDTVATMQELDPPHGKVSLARAFRLDAVELLLKAADRSQEIYASPPGPKSELAAAKRLVATFEVLQSLAIVAEKESDGALIKERRGSTASQLPGAQGEPWLPSRPKSVADIPVFATNLPHWRRTIADYNHRSLGDRPGRRSTKSTGTQPDPPQLVLMGRSTNRAPVSPLLLYFGNHGKIISLVKTKDMTLKTESGRVAVLSRIVESVGDRARDGSFPDNTGFHPKGHASAEELAKILFKSDLIGDRGEIARVFFQAEMTEVNLLDHLAVGQSMQIVVDQHALNTIDLFTPLRPEFKAPPGATKQGCAAIEWLKELMTEVPAEYKMLWVLRKIEDDRGVYAGNLTPGMIVPMEHFMPAGDSADKNEMSSMVVPMAALMPASGKPKSREVMFLGGSGDAVGELLILTEDGRILSINERLRNTQSFCTAIMSVAPWVAGFYMVAAAAGIVIAGELLPAVLGEMLAGGSRVATGLTTGIRLTEAPRLVQWADTLVGAKHWQTIVHGGVAAATIAFDVHEAGGMQEYLKKLNNPWEAAFLLLNLLSVKGALKTGELQKIMQESRALGKSAQQLVRQEQTAVRGATAIADREATIASRAKDTPGVAEVKGELAATRATESKSPQISHDQRSVQNRLGDSAKSPQKPESMIQDEVGAMRDRKRAAAQAAEERKQAIEAVAVQPQQKAVGDYEEVSMASRGGGGKRGGAPPTKGSVQTSPSGGKPSPNRVVTLTALRASPGMMARARKTLESLVNSRGTRYVIQGDEAEFRETKLGYHVYEYFSKPNAQGERLYTGVSGGERGARALRDSQFGFHNWVKRLQNSHINTEWIGEARSVRVTYNLTEQEMWALEEELIPLSFANKELGRYTRIKEFASDALSVNVQSAQRQPKAIFAFEYVPLLEP